MYSEKERKRKVPESNKGKKYMKAWLEKEQVKKNWWLKKKRKLKNTWKEI